MSEPTQKCENNTYYFYAKGYSYSDTSLVLSVTEPDKLALFVTYLSCVAHRVSNELLP